MKLWLRQFRYWLPGAEPWSWWMDAPLGRHATLMIEIYLRSWAVGLSVSAVDRDDCGAALHLGPVVISVTEPRRALDAAGSALYDEYRAAAKAYLDHHRMPRS